MRQTEVRLQSLNQSFTVTPYQRFFMLRRWAFEDYSIGCKLPRSTIEAFGDITVHSEGFRVKYAIIPEPAPPEPFDLHGGRPYLSELTESSL